MKTAQTLRDAAILVGLVLLATSVRVTNLPESPQVLPQVQAATPAVAPQAAPPVLPSVERPPADGAACPHRQRLTVRGDEPGQVIVIEVEIDPRLRAALGLCPAADDDPRPVPAEKA